MRFSVVNLGCKVNAYECESVASMLEEAGHVRVSNDEARDATVVFTCAVTNTAAQKSRQQIHRIRRRYPDSILAVAGCYAQIDPQALKDAEILVGSAHKKRIPEYIEQYIRKQEPIMDVEKIEVVPFEDLVLDHLGTHSRVYLKIQDGCNQFCAYCVIPYARGRERSMEPERVAEEARKLCAKYQEIVLTGIHTGRYGREYGVSLTQIMKRILAEAPETFRLRISSIEITEIDDELIALMKEDKRVARHLHIPVQAGCDATLKRMNRPYTTDEFYNRLQEIRRSLPDVSVSTDLIVGFPGETEEEFLSTLSFLRKCELSFLHVFPFSLRDGTAAQQLPDHIAPAVKKQRAAEAAALSEELYDDYRRKWTGRDVDVLVEKCEDGISYGYTSEYVPAAVEGECPVGRIVHVHAVDTKDHRLICTGVSYEAE